MEKLVKVEADTANFSDHYCGEFFGYNFTYTIETMYKHRKSLLRAMRQHAERMGFDVDWSKCNG